MIHFEDILNKVHLSLPSELLSINGIFLTLSYCLALSILLFYIYRIFTNTEFYSKSFNITLALIPTVTCAIILAMQSSLVISLGMVGALSIIRYRTVIKSPLDLFFMLLAFAIGIICGSGQYFLVFIMFILVIIILSIFVKIRPRGKNKILVIYCKNIQIVSKIQAIVSKNTTCAQMRSISMNNNLVELIFDIKTKNNICIEELLKLEKNVSRFSLISS